MFGQVEPGEQCRVLTASGDVLGVLVEQWGAVDGSVVAVVRLDEPYGRLCAGETTFVAGTQVVPAPVMLACDSDLLAGVA